MRRYFVCGVQRFFGLQCARIFLGCVLVQCAGFILFSEWDCILCPELEFILFAVHFILQDE